MAGLPLFRRIVLDQPGVDAMIRVLGRTRRHRSRFPVVIWCACLTMLGSLVRADDDATPQGDLAAASDTRMTVTAASQQDFPRIAVQFEVRKPDGTFLLDATRDDFRVTEDGLDVSVLEFQAPQTKELIPTTIVLVVDHSGSMELEDRIGALKEAIASFLEKLPEGSHVAVVAFSSDVRRLCPFTDDRDRVKNAVSRLRPLG
ncbi:MAG TPA: VWA domain-containing protein [Isosphaeraceae bacterium]|nr:VWA domain-containing protein [Isosphaeraceae bacterium]